MSVLFHIMFVFFFHTWTFQTVNTFFSITKVNNTFPNYLDLCKMYSQRNKGNGCRKLIVISSVLPFDNLLLSYNWRTSVWNIIARPIHALSKVCHLPGFGTSTHFLPVSNYLQRRPELRWVVAGNPGNPSELAIPTPNCYHKRQKPVIINDKAQNEAEMRSFPLNGA